MSMLKALLLFALKLTLVAAQQCSDVDSNGHYRAPDGTTSIGIDAFHTCAALISLDLNEVVSVGQGGFKACASLMSVTANTLQTVGLDGFAGCFSLTSFSSNSLQTVGNFGFAGCASLTSFSANSLQTVGMGGFTACASLTSFSANSLQTVGVSAFSNTALCTSAVSIPNALLSTLSFTADCASPSLPPAPSPSPSPPTVPGSSVGGEGCAFWCHHSACHEGECWNCNLCSPNFQASLPAGCAHWCNSWTCGSSVPSFDTFFQAQCGSCQACAN